jgi:hypothetical protein
MRTLAESFDDRELAGFGQVFEESCRELGYGTGDAERDEIAAIIIGLAKGGERDLSTLRKLTVDSVRGKGRK